MHPNPYLSLQTMEPINDADFAALSTIRGRLDSLSGWAIADHFGSVARTSPPTARAVGEPIELRALAFAVQQMNLASGPPASGAIASMAVQVCNASERLSASGELTAEQRSDIDQVWQAIVQMDRFAQRCAAMK